MSCRGSSRSASWHRRGLRICRRSAAVEELRECLLEERWADAIFSWVEMSGVTIDAYPDEIVATDAGLDAERAALEVRMTPLFRDTEG